MDYKKALSASNGVINFGIFIFVCQLVVNLIFKFDIPFIGVCAIISYIVIILGLLTGFVGRNVKNAKGDTVRVWVASKKFNNEVNGQFGKWIDFPAHCVPQKHDKIRVEDKDLPGGSTMLRITDRQHIIINGKHAAIKLYCLV